MRYFVSLKKTQNNQSHPFEPLKDDKVVAKKTIGLIIGPEK